MNTIILTNSDSIVAKLNGGVSTDQPDFVISYADNDGSTFEEKRSEGTLSGTTPVTIVSSPAASTRRIVKSITIYNTDTSNVVLSILFDNGTSQRVITKITLEPGDFYVDGNVYTDLGQVKTANTPTTSTVTLTGIQTLTNKTLADLSNKIYADEVHFAGYNESGSTILKGTPVYISGYNVGNDEAEIGLADAGLISQSPAIGITGEDIVNASVGSVVVSGIIEGLDTSAYSVGDLLYLDVIGGLTNIKPNYTFTASYVQAMAVVLRSNAGAGVIQVLPYLPYLRLPTGDSDLTPKGYVDNEVEDVQNPSSTTRTANYTLDNADTDRIDRVNSATAITVTVPPNSTEAFPYGYWRVIRQIGAGQVTVAEGSGVTVNGDKKTADQHKGVMIVKVGPDVWDIYGGVA